MQREQRERVDEFDGKIAVAGGVDTVCRWAVKPQFHSHGLTIERERRSGHRARSQRTKIRALAAIGQARSVAEKHFHIGQQPMRDQNGFSWLQVRVGGHGHVTACGFGARENRLDPIGDQVLQSVDALAHEEAEVGRDLFVAAAAGVQLVAGRSDQRGELFFYEVVDVFGFRIVEKFGEVSARWPISSAPSRFRKALRRKALLHVRARWHGRGWRRVQRAAAVDRRETTAAIFQIQGQAAAGNGPTTSSLCNLCGALTRLGTAKTRVLRSAQDDHLFSTTIFGRLHARALAPTMLRLGAATRGQSQYADEAFRIFLIIACAHGE